MLTMYTAAEGYIQLNINNIVLELVKDDNESFASNVSVLNLLGKESEDYAIVNIQIINIKFEHKQVFLDQIEEKFGLKLAWLIEDKDYEYESNKAMRNYNLLYKVPMNMIEMLAALYKMS